ncbi:class I SAM-dependent methyltransferase [Devosia aurantiaca]|uniref:Methyltransferase domain-containing protein n=1 Tax=Devosia aurantiaca TaxID=2714858 RepID=A0A6M1SFX5_9HYPH|nr:SAM-dependent methyltransferase [Devosia aurantiaca]NGP18407.1 methyltransferase domain-containing protein [Devosia aurantiaca]
MSKRPIDIHGFEAKFRDNSDPWNYEASAFEAYKRGVLRRACGSRLYGRGLELACANGETTKMLANFCLKLLAVDGSKTAAQTARDRTRHLSNVEVLQALLPQDMPRGPFDLIVISELLYYLKRHDLDETLRLCADALAPGGRIVCLHHVIPFDDVSVPPRMAQDRANTYLGRRFRKLIDAPHGRFKVSAFQRPRLRVASAT